MKFYGQSIATGGGSKEPLDQILYERYFKDQKTGFFIEAGANDGLFLSNCKVFDDIGWSGINIEPSFELFSKLIVNRPKNLNLNIALSNKSGSLYFEYITFDNGGFSRLSDSKQESVDKTFHLKVNNKYKVISRTYKEIIELYQIKEVDLFVLDVENHELEVIDGMVGGVWPKYFCVEYGHVGLDKLKDKLKDNYNFDWYDAQNSVFIRKVLV
jgi:FkbM family methyltransferase